MNSSTDYPFFRSDKPRIIGHRGAMGEAPENTFLSFQRALDDGAFCIELDVRGTKDGQIVILHDATLDRTTNGHGAVNEWALSDLKKLDAGYWFTQDHGRSYPHRGQKTQLATLEEYFSAFPNARTIIEVKPLPAPIVRDVVATVHRLGKGEQVLLATERDSVMNQLRREIKEKKLVVATGFSYGEVAAFLRWVGGGAAEFTPLGQAFQIPCEYGGMTLVSTETVRAAHGLGLEVFVWTINDPAEIKRLLDLGVDGIITDYPARAQNLLRSPHP